jgi:hypothetical protein
VTTEPGMQGRRFTVDGDVIIVDLFEPERDLLGHLLPQLREMLMADGDTALRRLKPPARPDDAEAEQQFRELVDDDMMLARLEAIETVEQGIDGARLDSEGVDAWMKSLNALRLVVGELLVDLGVDLAADERLDTGDEDTEPGEEELRIAQMRNWLDWLGSVIWDLVDAASSMLPDD